MLGAVIALAVSFAVLALAWRTPRYDAATSGHLAPRVIAAIADSTAFAVVLRVLGMVFFLYCVAIAVFGKDLLTNPIFGIFYVYWWVGLVPLSFLFGRVYRAISPVRTIQWLLAKLTGGDPEDGVRPYPEWLGYWPAALGLFAFVWMELTYPHRDDLGPVRLWCAAYVAVMLLGGAVFGSGFFARADPFEVYSSLVGKLSIWARRDGVLIVRSPLANLDSVVPRPGLVAVMAVLFGSTAFDSFGDSQPWIKFVQNTHFIISHGRGPDIATNVGLIVFILVVGAVFALGTMLTGVGPEQRRRDLPNLFAHSIVPIVIGYILAHYLTYLIEVGQQTLIQMSDPFGTGANYLGTGNWRINYWLSYHPSLLASSKVGFVVLGHVVGVVAAHDRAIKLLPAKHQITGQLTLLVAMIAFTVGGIYLLFST